MTALRILGGVFAVAFFALALVRYRRRRISRLNLMFSCLISVVVLLLAIGPSLFDPLFEIFDFQPGGKRIVVVSPAFNEAENVGAVLEAIPRELEGYRVVPIVIDDASDDGTPEAARAAGALVASLPIRRGGGLALRVGYDLALGLRAHILVTMDADGQHQPEELPTLPPPLPEGRA